MKSIGADYHPSFQQIAFFEEENGECGEEQLNHGDGEAERFYRDLKQQGIWVRVGWRLPDIHAGSSDCTSPVRRPVLIRLFQPKADILGVAEPGTTTAGGDLKGPDKPKATYQI